ncbi:MAG: septum formation initiator family protein [Candidatus Paceibacterota bacterium]
MLAKKGKKRKGGGFQAKITKGLGILAFIFLFSYLSFANVKILIARMEAGKNLSELTNTTTGLEKEKDRLNLELGKTGSEEFLEKVAREELGFQKQGEQVIVVRKEESNLDKEPSKTNRLQFVEDFANWIGGLFKGLTQ